MYKALADAIRRLGPQRALLVLDDRLKLRQCCLGVALGGQADAEPQLDPLGQFLLRLAIKGLLEELDGSIVLITLREQLGQLEEIRHAAGLLE